MRLEYGKGLTVGALMTTLLAVAAPQGAQAAVVQASFTANVISDFYAGNIGTGTFSYADDTLTGVENEFVSPANNAGFTLEFDFLGHHYSAADDVDAPSFPRIHLTAGVPISIDFLVTRNPLAPNPTDIPQADIGSFSLQEALVADGAGGFRTTMTVSPLPTPLPAAGFLLAPALAVLVRRDRRAGRGAA